MTLNRNILADRQNFKTGLSQTFKVFASDFKWCYLAEQGSPSVMQHVLSVESSSLLLHCIKT